MSVYPYFNYGVLPYMNNRVYTGAPQSITGDIGFAANADIVITWLDDGTNAALANGIINIYANNRWGTDDNVIGHRLYVFAKYAALPAPIITVPVKEFLNAGNANANPQYSIAYVSGAGQQGYWTNYGGIWYRIVQATNHGIVNVYANLNPAVPGIPPTGIDATKYSISVRQSDLNYIATQQPDTTQNTHVPVLVPSSGRYDLCWMNNQLHTPLHDAAFYIMPDGFREYDEIPDRTELNSRVAGEKALYEDEFLTAGQIEGSANVTLRWRNLDGSLTGYSTDAAKGGNLVIEATGGGGGVTRHQGANANGSVYYDEVTNIIRFQNFPRLHEEPIDGIIPIEFKVYTAPGSVGVIRAHGVNNNLYVSRGEGPVQYTIHTYPMFDAGFTEDQTVNHLRFRDTDTVEWNLLGTTMPTQTENGIIYRKGVVIRANAVTAFTGWYLQEVDSSPATQPQLISNNETVQVEGINGVVCSLSLPNGTTTKLQIDRPLRLYRDAIPVGAPDTVQMRFTSYKGQESWKVLWANMPNWSLPNHDFTEPTLHGCLELDTVPFYVKDRADEGHPGRRDVYAYVKNKSTMAQTQWAMDYDALGGQGRTLGYYQGAIINDLMLGNLGLFADGNGVNPPRLPGCRIDYHIVDGSITQNFTKPYSKVYAYFEPRYWPTTNFYGGIGGTVGSGALIPRWPGLYRITYRVQGLMGLPAGVTFNPVVHPRIHSFIMNDGNDGNDLSYFHTINGRPNATAKRFKSGVSVVGGMWSLSDYIPQVGTPAQSSANYLPVINSRPWEVSGEGLIAYDGHTHGNMILLRYNPGTGENRFSFQVCYMYMSIEQVADYRDVALGRWDMPTYNDPTYGTLIHGELNALSSNYNFGSF